MTTDDFYLKQEEPLKSCLLTMREIILQQDDQISETLKYGLPCFLFGKKILCYLWKDKKTKHPYILMSDGLLIEHPKLEQGDRKKMKSYSVNPNMDLNLAEIKDILSLGIDLHR